MFNNINDTYLLFLDENQTSIGNGSVQHPSQEEVTGMLLYDFSLIKSKSKR